ncbi:MAG TPA: hypothetical protein VJU15_01865 [Gemmatimonadales bacterium]|nr:hypothetical protein [Gemmatimonadales bacterium]
MSDEAPDSTQQIESLLADRQRLRGWLDRLDAAQDRAPAQVKTRVRGDYEGRLAEVVARLGGFSTTISASLETLRSQRAAYESKRAEIEEVRAEAGLRHDVGEYSDDEWGRLDGDANQNIQALSGEIGRLSAEISRLDEVLAQVAPPEPARREPPARPLREVRSEDRLDIHVLEPEELTLTPRGKHSTDDNQNVVTLDPDTMDDIEAIRPESRPAPVEAPRFTPKSGSTEPRPQPARDRGPARTIRFPTQQPPAEASGAPSVDEMTFLKSVTLDSPASRERAAADQRPSASSARARSPNASKTLKCAECGSMNKPTEWYCERCGAELAAL